MLLIKTYVEKSKIHGFGLFAAEAIKKGTLIWKFDKKLDIGITKKELAKMPNFRIDWVKHYGYYDRIDKKYIVCFDEARYMNHSNQSNTDDTHYTTTANRDIKKGEEITANYFDFDGDVLRKISKSKK